jgi:hypothetical protein
MKPAMIALVGSLAFNALIVGAMTLRPATPAGVTEAGPLPPPAPRVALSGEALLALEPAALHAELRRQNLPREAVDALVLARIYERHDARRREFVRAAAQRPWWEVARGGLGGLILLTPEQRKELRDLEAAARPEALRLLGPAALDRDGAISGRYSFVPAERAVQLDAVQRDYDGLAAMLREEMRGLRTNADREREKLLGAERERDLAKLLTPAEAEILELRLGPAGDQMPTFEPTETEYRALFAVYRDFHANNPGSVAADGRVQPRNFAEYPEYQEKVRAALGEERYADWRLVAQPYTLVLARLAPDLGYSNTTVKETARFLRDTAARSWAIGEDAALTVDEKTAALATLADRTKATLTEKLGAAGSAALLRDTPWIDMIARGNAVKVDGGTTWQPVNRVRPPLPPRG